MGQSCETLWNGMYIYMYIYATDLNSEFKVVKIDLIIFLLTVFGKKRYWSHAKSDERKLRHRR